MARLASPPSHKQPSQTDQVSPPASLLALARLLGRIASHEYASLADLRDRELNEQITSIMSHVEQLVS